LSTCLLFLLLLLLFTVQVAEHLFQCAFLWLQLQLLFPLFVYSSISISSISSSLCFCRNICYAEDPLQPRHICSRRIPIHLLLPLAVPLVLLVLLLVWFV
jgi:hypothetical protein